MDSLSPGSSSLCPIMALEDIGSLRREVREAIEPARPSQSEMGKIELASTELATNLLRHANPGGYILFNVRPPGTGFGLELLSVDRGPGISDFRRFLVGEMGGSNPLPADVPLTAPARCVSPTGSLPTGGITERGGLGIGLAAVRRLASAFDMYSSSRGTVILSRFLPENAPSPIAVVRLGAVNVPLVPQEGSGDGWAVKQDGDRLYVLVVDGLGHGCLARQAAEVACATFQREKSYRVEDVVLTVHEAMLKTRGCALSLACIDLAHDEVSYVGVGNVEGHLILSGKSHGLTALNGTVGIVNTMPRVKTFPYPWGPGATMILHTDGVRSRFLLETHPGLLEHDPSVIAAAYHSDQSRGHDDATVVVVQDVRKRS